MLSRLTATHCRQAIHSRVHTTEFLPLPPHVDSFLPLFVIVAKHCAGLRFVFECLVCVTFLVLSTASWPAAPTPITPCRDDRHQSHVRRYGSLSREDRHHRRRGCFVFGRAGHGALQQWHNHCALRLASLLLWRCSEGHPTCGTILRLQDFCRHVGAGL